MSRRRALLAAVLASSLAAVQPGAATAETAPAVTGAGAPAATDVVATDAPRVVRVGAPVTPVPMTVITADPVDAVTVSALGARGEVVGDGLAPAAEVGRPTVYKVDTVVRAQDLEAWGPHRWVISGVSTGVDQSLSLPVEVRAHSLLGMAVSRRGGDVSVRGSARAYHSVLGRYVPWSGRPVSVQVIAGDGYLQVTGARTDARGNFSTTVSLPPDATLRLVVTDVPTIWGASSEATTV